jgi:hypothetical protein
LSGCDESLIFGRRFRKLLSLLADSYIDITTALSMEQVLKRLQDITVPSSSKQTQYHHLFVGQINEQGGTLHNIYSSMKNRIIYELKLLSIDDITIIRISTNEFEKQQIASALMKAFIIPVGFLIIILNIVFYSDIVLLIFMLFFSAILIVPTWIYKPEPLTPAQYLKDPNIRKIMQVLDGTARV